MISPHEEKGTVTNHGAVALVGVKAAAKLINLDNRRRGVVSLDIVASFVQESTQRAT